MPAVASLTAAQRRRFSTIAHGDHRFMSPLTEEKVDRVRSMLDVAPGARVVDIGCGSGEMLLRLVERSGAVGLGIDRNDAAIEEAQRRTAGMLARDAAVRVEWKIGEALPAFEGEALFDAALCIGATGAFGGLHGALAGLHRLVRPGGSVAIGEGFWRRPPEPEYLAALGATVDEMTSHAGVVAAVVAAGFTPVYSVVSSDDEWDHYEGLYRRAMVRWLAAHPRDPDHAAFSLHSERWYDMYLRWGRSTLGFGVYVLRRDGARGDIESASS